MKKLITLLSAIAITTTMVSCGGKEEKTDATAPEGMVALNLENLENNFQYLYLILQQLNWK